ncbi:MAG: type IV pilin protein [Pseudomonadota bacterium]
MKKRADRPVLSRGFTLIEMLIVVVILGIITTIAVQSFSGASKDGERARIISEMNSLNDAVGRYYQGSYSYEDITMADIRGQIEASKYYTVTIVHPLTGGVPDVQRYFLIAKPLSTGMMAGEGTYSISNTGQHCYFPDDDDADPATDGCPKAW